MKRLIITALVLALFALSFATDAKRPSAKVRGGLYKGKIADTINVVGSNTASIYLDTGTTNTGFDAGLLDGDSIVALVWGIGDSAACTIRTSISESPDNGTTYVSVKGDTITCGTAEVLRRVIVAKNPGSKYRVRIGTSNSCKIHGAKVMGNETK